MADENGPADSGVAGLVVGPARRRLDSTERPTLFARLGGADYVSLGALLAAWASALLFVSREPNWALLAMFAAYGLDKLDGYYARTFGEPSDFGRRLDAYVDAHVYLVTAALLYHFALSPHVLASALVGFLLLAFGGLRLVRHAGEGFGDDGGTSYYVGVTVVHANLVVVANYFLVALVPGWTGWLAAVPIAAVCPLMCSRYRSYKTTGGHVLAALGGLVAAGLALAFEYTALGGV